MVSHSRHARRQSIAAHTAQRLPRLTRLYNLCKTVRRRYVVEWKRGWFMLGFVVWEDDRRYVPQRRNIDIAHVSVRCAVCDRYVSSCMRVSDTICSRSAYRGHVRLKSAGGRATDVQCIVWIRFFCLCIRVGGSVVYNLSQVGYELSSPDWGE